MFASIVHRLSAFAIVFFALQLGTAVAALVEERDLQARGAPSAPHFVVYADSYQPGVIGPPPVLNLKGYNTYIMSFWSPATLWDKAYEWTILSASERSSVKSKYHAAGIKLLVAAFGSTDVPTTAGADPVATANNLAGWVKAYGLDGVDVDYEDLSAMDSGHAEAWLIKFTKQLRSKLPSSSNYIITHAPLAPWFTPSHYPGGGYLKVHQEVGSSIDWYNVQFYNQGTSEYTTCSGLLTSSSARWPKTALFQIIAAGVSSSKLVIGKPATIGDAATGYVSPWTLASCISEAKGKGWKGGITGWQYPHADSAWIRTVRSKAWPV